MHFNKSKQKQWMSSGHRSELTGHKLKGHRWLMSWDGVTMLPRKIVGGHFCKVAYSSGLGGKGATPGFTDNLAELSSYCVLCTG